MSSNTLFVHEETRPLDLRKDYILLGMREQQERLQLARWNWTSHDGDLERDLGLKARSVYVGLFNTFLINRESR